MLKIIRKLLLRIIERIDSGNSNLTEEEAISAISMLEEFTNKEKPISKYTAYTYLGISRAKFDRLVQEGKLPKGKKVLGFKELQWSKKEIDSCLKSINN